jgi:hypothetical protein
MFPGLGDQHLFSESRKILLDNFNMGTIIDHKNIKYESISYIIFICHILRGGVA